MKLILPVLAVVVALYGCTPPARPPATATIPAAAGAIIHIVDATGATVVLPAVPHRIVSAAPSITETLYKLGVQNRLVLDTTSCRFPAAAAKKPHFNAMSADVEPILAANPDLVICVAGEDTRLLPGLLKAGVPVLQVKASSLADVYQSIQLIGSAVNAAQAAIDLNQNIATRIHIVEGKVSGLTRPSVLMVYSSNPIYTTGPKSFISDVVTAAGGHNAVSTEPVGDVLSSEQAIALHPQVIICDKDVAVQLENLPGWRQSVPAVINHRFYSDDNLNRPGPSLAGACERLAAWLHPGHAGLSK